MFRVKLVVLLTAILLGNIAPSQALAVVATPEANPEDRAIAFHPEATGFGTFITVELEPGASTVVVVTLGNAGNVEQTIRTYAIPAKSGINGGFVLPEYGTDIDKQTSWLDYPESEFTFLPGEGVNLEVGINVPKDASPGEYVTSLAAEQANAFEVEGTDLFTQRVRWSVPILIVVPGEREPAFSIGDAKLEMLDTALYGTIAIRNEGNVIVRPAGEVRLLNNAGEVVGVAKVELGSIYSGTETTFVVGWANAPTSDSYTVEVDLAAENNTSFASKTISDLVPTSDVDSAASDNPLSFGTSELTPLTRDNPPSMLQLDAEISNNGEPIENARVSIVTYQDGVEVDRYPVLQAITIQQGSTPVQARYALPGGFTSGTYTFEVTIELGDIGTQTILVTQKLEYTITAP